MAYIPTFAPYFSTLENNNIDEATIIGPILVTLFIELVFIAVAYVVIAIFLTKIFKKAHVQTWIAWVPIYNHWKLLEIGGQQGFWAILAIIPFINYISSVFTYIAMYHIGKKLGKEGTFVLLAIVLPIVWFIWLGIDTSKWNDKASSAPSLHKPVKT